MLVPTPSCPAFGFNITRSFSNPPSFGGWSVDSRYLATSVFGGSGHVIIWNSSTGREVTRLQHDTFTDSVAGVLDGRMVATTTWTKA